MCKLIIYLQMKNEFLYIKIHVYPFQFGCLLFLILVKF